MKIINKCYLLLIREIIQIIHNFKFQYPSEFRRDNAREISQDDRIGWKIIEIKLVCVLLVGNIVMRVLISASLSNYHINSPHLCSLVQVPSAKGRQITANLLMKAYAIMAKHCSTCMEFFIHISMQTMYRSNIQYSDLIILIIFRYKNINEINHLTLTPSITDRNICRF